MPKKSVKAWAWQSKHDGSLALIGTNGGGSLHTAPTRKMAMQIGCDHDTHRIVRVTITIDQPRRGK